MRNSSAGARLMVTMALICGAALARASAQASEKTGRTHTAAAPADGAAGAAGIRNVFWQPNAIKQGSDAFFTVELERPAVRVTGTWAGKTLSFFKTGDAKVWYALAGDDLETPVGSYDLKVTAVLAGGHLARISKPVEVAAGVFKEGTVDVPENFVDPDAASKRMIAQDEVAKARAYARSAPKPLWSGDFIKPVEAPSTPSFGESRILNEEKSSLHRGTDFPVKEGSLVRAANTGVVVLAREMFYEGNCVIVDHGDRFFTIYMHLSKMDVQVGDKLAKGAKIGLSGATGRVTGPHLHFGARWSGAYLDPVALLALTLPKNTP